MSNKFCRFLSNGASLSIQQGKLMATPCCWSDHLLPVNDQFLNNKLKQWTSIDSWTPECKVCHQQEQANIKSFRQSSFEILPNGLDNSIAALDINLDMTCNAACVICTPTYSTTWTTQYKKFNIPLVEQPNYNFEQELDRVFDSLNFNHIKRIKFFGGEPLLTDTHVKVLKQIVDPKNCEIWYTTNASILPSREIFELWQKFKLVYFEASIDGVDEQFEYIRWPLKWKKIENNLLTLKDTAPVNVLFRINHTLNPLNIYYYDRLEQWVSVNFSANRLGDPTEINIHPCWGDWALDRTPHGLRRLVYEKYQEHDVSNLLAQCQQQSHITILEFGKLWDTNRKNNWQSIFSEVAEYFN